jgi:hypothetical protein
VPPCGRGSLRGGRLRLRRRERGCACGGRGAAPAAGEGLRLRRERGCACAGFREPGPAATRAKRAPLSRAKLVPERSSYPREARTRAKPASRRSRFPSEARPRAQRAPGRSPLPAKPHPARSAHPGEARSRTRHRHGVLALARPVRPKAATLASAIKLQLGSPHERKKPRSFLRGFRLRGEDLNLRPSGYEPDELPGCSTARQ